MHRRDEHERHGGKILWGQVSIVADDPTRRDLHVLGVPAPSICPGWEVARRFVLGRDVPLRRVRWETGSHDDPLSERASLDLGAKLLDVANDV